MEGYLSSFLPDADARSKTQLVSSSLAARTAHPYKKILHSDLRELIIPRKEFSHKGTYGHALIIAGEAHTMGAALLAAKGCLYAGAGLTTACIPESGLAALNTALPEVMFLPREKLFENTTLDKYNVLAIGPGIGVTADAEALLSSILALNRPVIADADALNLLASNSLLMQSLTKDSILTPHMKEFDNLFGAHVTWFDRLQTARKQAVELGIVILLKNQYTFVVDQQGIVCINTTGCPAMAQGGMGDVLTGIIAAYVAQGNTSRDAAILGCYLHGSAGSVLARKRFNVTASEVAEQLPETVKHYLYG